MDELTARDLLETSIAEANELIGQYAVGTPERKAAVEEYDRLYKLRLEEQRVADAEYEADERRKFEVSVQEQKLELEQEKLRAEEARALLEDEMKQKQLKHDKVKTWTDAGLRMLGFAGWVAATFGVMNLETKGYIIRSKGDPGRTPKMKF